MIWFRNLPKGLITRALKPEPRFRKIICFVFILFVVEPFVYTAIEVNMTKFMSQFSCIHLKNIFGEWEEIFA